MKLVIISPYPPNPGGLSTYTKRLVDHLKTRDEVVVKVIPFNSFRDIASVLKLGRPDFVRLEYNIPAYGLSTILLYLIILTYRVFTPIKLVVNYHEVSRETEMLGIIGRIFYYTFSSIFHHIYVHTNEAGIILVNKCRINPLKISIIPLGTMQSPNADMNYDVRKYYSLDKRKIVLSFGFIHPDKGIEYALQAIAMIKTNNPKLYAAIQFVIAGDVRTRTSIFRFFQKKDNDYKRKLIDMANNLGITDSVTFVRYVRQEDVGALIKQSYLALLPYTKVEQSGVLNLLIPTGIPIIASDIGGLGETLRETGILVKVKYPAGIAKEIDRLVNEPKYYERIKSSYVKLSKKLHVSRVTDQFLLSLTKV